MTSIHDLKNNFHCAMHGGGAYRGLRQSNTKEAILYWYARGVRVFEVDMAHTDDNDYVAVAHHLDQKDLRRLEIFDYPDQKTKTWFMNQRLFTISTNKGLTPLSLENIVDLLAKFEDLIIMFDLYGLFSMEEAGHFTAKLFSFIDNQRLWNRCLLEAYNMDMVDGIKRYSQDANIIYCVRYEGNLKDSTTVTPLELLDKSIKFVSYPWFINRMYPGEISKYTSSGITVFSRTKSNINTSALKECGVSVNIVANKFDKTLFPIQWLLYMLTYLKRAIVKTYIKIKY